MQQQNPTTRVGEEATAYTKEEQSILKTLKTGHQVLYVLGADDPVSEEVVGEIRPATIIKIIDRENGCANLAVTIDGLNDVFTPGGAHYDQLTIPTQMW